jgi:hypothetical protein
MVCRWAFDTVIDVISLLGNFTGICSARGFLQLQLQSFELCFGLEKNPFRAIDGREQLGKASDAFTRSDSLGRRSDGNEEFRQLARW